MKRKKLPIEIPKGERTLLVNWLVSLVAEQQEIIWEQQEKITKLEEKVSGLDEELKAAKKLNSKAKIRPSTLNLEQKKPKKNGKRAGSEKRSKKLNFEVDEERIIEPEEELPKGATFNGYREYDVQDLIVQRHNIRFLLAEYVTVEGKTIVGKLPQQYHGHYGPTLMSFTLYQHHQCRVPQNLICEQLRELGVDISTGQVNRILIENKESFHAEQNQILQVGLETAQYIHTDDTGTRHQGQNGYCTVIGNELFAHFSSTKSKSRENYLRILRGTAEDFVLNEYSRSYLEQQKLPACHLYKLKFSSQIISNSDQDWSQYLQQLGITSKQGIKLLTEAGLLGSAIEHGLSPKLIVLSDGAKQFALLVHALCWIHMERSLRRLNGMTAQHRREIEQVQDALWSYYHQLKAYQLQPTPQDKTRLELLFDEIFQPSYPHHYGLNLVLHQFSSHKYELLRVLDFPQLPLHTNAAETDIREYVTRRKISGGTRHENGRQARDTFTSLKKTCRKLGLSFWQYLLSRITKEKTVPYLPDLIQARAIASAPT